MALLIAALTEVACPARYFRKASSINFRRSVIYGFGVLATAIEFRLARWGLHKPAWLSANGRRMTPLQAGRGNLPGEHW